MKITIPNHISDISLEHFRKIEKLEDNGGTEWIAEALAIVTELSHEQIFALPLNDIEKIGNILQKLFDHEEQEVPLQKIIEHKGQKLGFHPNLTNITVGEWADLETLLEQGWLENMGKVLSILYRPVTVQAKNEYDIAPYIGYGEDAEQFWNDIKMDIVLGAVGFFLHTASVLASNSRNYSMDQAAALYSPKNGAGTPFFMRWLKAIRLILKR